jgi:putative MFS transporter
VSEPLTPAHVAARLDRLPVTRFHRRFLMWISLGAWFDLYDNFLSSALAVALPAAGVVGGDKDALFSQLGLVMAALPLGMFVGCVFLGSASDYLGRRFGFIALLLLYSLAALAGGAGYYPLTAVAGTTAGLVLLLVSRFLAGAGVGAENVVIDVYVSEVVPRQVRGWAVALTHAIAFTAMPTVALLARLLVPKEAPHGWWLLLVIGSLGALFTWYFRRGLPESPRWSATVGRAAEAEATLAAIETAVEKETGQPLPPPAPVTAVPVTRRLSFAEIWSPRYRGRTVMLTAFQLLQTIGYYGFIHWVGKFLLAKGFNQNQALEMSLGVALLAPVGPILGMWSSERFQRKWLLVGLALMLALTQLSFGLATEAWALIALGALVVVCLNWFSAIFHAYQAELFPTEARATGVGFTYAWSRASMVGLNLLMPGIIARDLMGAFGLMAGAMVGVATIVALFGPLTNALALEEVSPDEPAEPPAPMASSSRP